MPWTDAHCHVHDPKVAARDPYAEASAQGVTRLVTVGCDEATSRAAIDAAAAPHGDVGVWATVGCHPHDAALGWDWAPALLDDAVARRVVAVGECGLDYHYDHSPRDVQRAAFAAQVELAHRCSLPLVIHTRSAWDDTFAVLRDCGMPPNGTMFHCFTGGAAEAETCLALHDGVVLSFSGIITFPSATDLRDAAAVCPLHRLLVETDAPYLAPVPHRGRVNVPALVPVVGAAVAAVKGVDADAVAAATWTTAARLFGLDAAVDDSGGSRG